MEVPAAYLGPIYDTQRSHALYPLCESTRTVCAPLTLSPSNSIHSITNAIASHSLPKASALAQSRDTSVISASHTLGLLAAPSAATAAMSGYARPEKKGTKQYQVQFRRHVLGLKKRETARPRHAVNAPMGIKQARTVAAHAPIPMAVYEGFSPCTTACRLH